MYLIVGGNIKESFPNRSSPLRSYTLGTNSCSSSTLHCLDHENTVIYTSNKSTLFDAFTFSLKLYVIVVLVQSNTYSQLLQNSLIILSQLNLHIFLLRYNHAIDVLYFITDTHADTRNVNYYQTKKLYTN